MDTNHTVATSLLAQLQLFDATVQFVEKKDPMKR